CKDDVVVLMTDPPMLGATLGSLARARGAKVINWLQDLFPEVGETLLPSVFRIFAPGLRLLRDRGLRRADCNVVICESMAGRLVERSVPRERTVVVENWTDDDAILPLEPQHNTLRREWGLHDKFVVGHSGNLGRAHDWRTMLDVATALRERQDIHFLM